MRVPGLLFETGTGTPQQAIFFDGYCSTVQGLLDWFEVDLGFTELSFIQIDLCVLCVFVLYSRFIAPLLGHGVTRSRKKAIRCGRCRRNRQYTPGQKRKTWEHLHTAAPFFERITCLRERDGPTLPNLNLPSRDLNARQVKRRGERSRSGGHEI